METLLPEPFLCVFFFCIMPGYGSTAGNTYVKGKASSSPFDQRQRFNFKFVVLRYSDHPVVSFFGSSFVKGNNLLMILFCYNSLSDDVLKGTNRHKTSTAIKTQTQRNGIRMNKCLQIRRRRDLTCPFVVSLVIKKRLLQISS